LRLSLGCTRPGISPRAGRRASANEGEEEAAALGVLYVGMTESVRASMVVVLVRVVVLLEVVL